jgi:hypothetical protein
MEFGIKNIQENIVVTARKIGYLIIDSKDNGEYNLVRKLTQGNYPRFHIYAKVQGNKYIFNLHLDQKAPIYKGNHAHSGEYAGPVVETEADRICEVLVSSRY